MEILVQSFSLHIKEWIPSSPLTVVTITVGTMNLAVNLYRIRIVKRDATSLQQQALNELKHKILAHVEANDPRIVTATRFRSIAREIEQHDNIPIITDKLIIETIRSAALDIEDRYLPDKEEFLWRMELLDKALRELSDAERPLLSLAHVDRLGAYVRSQPYAVTMLFVIMVITLFFQLRFGFVAYIALLCLLLQSLLVLSTLRAGNYWRAASKRSWAPGRRSLLCPHRPNVVLDFFLVASTSRARWTDTFWDLVWGPVWENRLITRSNPDQVAMMHEFRYDAARNLARDLRGLLRERDLLRVQGRPVGNGDQPEFARLCRELWRVTGEERFREIERQSEIDLTEETNDTVRMLLRS